MNRWRHDSPERRDERRFVVRVGLLALALVAGCASVPPAPAPVPVATEVARHFELKGRISVRVDNRLDVAQLRWTRLPAEERLGFHTPFGTQVAELVKDAAGQVTLRQGEQTLHAASLSELSARAIGVSLDLDEVARWVQGAGLTADRANLVKLADGATWEVTIEGLQTVARYTRASRITAIKGDVVVKLVIDEWQPR